MFHYPTSELGLVLRADGGAGAIAAPSPKGGPFKV